MPASWRTPARPQAALARALGVTRVARVTGLDRAGVEVACAVRPGGHVLQVTNGKGRSFAAAARGALSEAAELWCAERVPADALVWRDDPASGARLAWRTAEDLASGEEVLVPAAAVHVPPAGGPLLGLAPVRWTSNGMGAHPRWDAALRHALLEAVERDAVARALPEGWHEEAVAACRVDGAELRRGAPRVAALVSALGRRGLAAHVFDLAPPGGAAAEVAGALLLDAEGAAVPLTAGYAAGLDRAEALEGALLEAAQSRLTDIHGAREDVAPMPERDVARLRRACARPCGSGSGSGSRPFDSAAGVRPLRSGWPASRTGRGAAAARPLRSGRPASRSRGDPGAAVAALVLALRRLGHAHVLALDLAPPELPLRVAKVLVPGLRLTELL
jgi:ribosomal protein S12 methylthiotransferase accessory factor